MKRTFFFLRFVVVWAASLASAYYAWHGVQACRNIVLAIAGLHWLTFLGILFMDHRAAAPEVRLPKWLIRPIALAYLVLLILPGYFGCALGLALMWAAMVHNRTLPPKSEEVKP